MNPRRGEVWWVRLDPTLGSEIKKTRPCVIVGTKAFEEFLAGLESNTVLPEEAFQRENWYPDRS